MAKVKNYGLIGVGSNVQLGKQGPHILADSEAGAVSFTAEDQITLAKVRGAAADSPDEFVTKSQLDAVNIAEATFSDDFDHTTTVINLGTIPAGTKTLITTINVASAFEQGSNATASVGTESNNSLLMGTTYNDLTAVGSYQTVNTVSFVTDSNVSIFVSAGGSQQGSGTVVVSYY